MEYSDMHGQKVRFTHRLTRKTRIKETALPGGRTYNATWKLWEVQPYEGEGLFLGMRTLKNGTRYWENEVGHIFEPTEHFRAALVSPGLHVNPIYVPIDCLTFE